MQKCAVSLYIFIKRRKKHSWNKKELTVWLVNTLSKTMKWYLVFFFIIKGLLNIRKHKGFHSAYVYAKVKINTCLLPSPPFPRITQIYVTLLRLALSLFFCNSLRELKINGTKKTLNWQQILPTEKEPTIFIVPIFHHCNLN